MNSPAWLRYVSPDFNDDIPLPPQDYSSGNDFVKRVYLEGEVDVVATGWLLQTQDLWPPPAAETSFALQAPAKVLAQKLFYRDGSLTARDLFDWRMLAEKAPHPAIAHEELATLLARGKKREDLNAAITKSRASMAFATSWDEIRTDTPKSLRDLIAWAENEIARYAALHQAAERNKAVSDAPDVNDEPAPQPERASNKHPSITPRRFRGCADSEVPASSQHRYHPTTTGFTPRKGTSDQRLALSPIANRAWRVTY